MGSFTNADLEFGYRDAKRSLAFNMSFNIKHCINVGNMMETKEKTATS